MQNRRRRPAAQFEQVLLPSVRVTSCPGAEGGGGEGGGGTAKGGRGRSHPSLSGAAVW